MGDFDECFFLGCQNKPDLKCDCSNSQIMCSLHLTDHLRDNQSIHHDIKLRKLDIFSDWLQKLPQLRINLLEAKNLSISNILNKYNPKIQYVQNLLLELSIQLRDKVSKISKKYDRLINSIQFLIDHKKSPKNSKSQYTKELLKQAEKTIENLFLEKEGKENKFVFHLRNKNLFRINIKNKRIKNIFFPSLPQIIDTQSTVVDWDPKTIFHFGCSKQSSCYKLSKDFTQITKLPDYPLGNAWGQGSVAFGKYIYLFGGNNWKWFRYGPNKQSFRFDTEKLSFTRIADLPEYSGRNSAVKVGKQILVSGQNMQGVYKYNLESDSFQLLFKLSCISNTTLFKTSKGEVILITGKNGVFKCRKKDFENWSKIEEEGIDSWSVTDRVEYDGQVSYIDQGSNLNSFDINSYMIKGLKLNLLEF